VPICDIGQIGTFDIDISSGQGIFKRISTCSSTCKANSTTGNTLLVGSHQTYTTIQDALTN